MAEISHGSGSAAARTSHTGDTNWTTVLTVSDAALKVDNAKYLIKVVAKIHSDDNATPLANFRMARGATPTELPRSWQKLEVGSSSDGNSHQYNWFHIFTQPATAEDILFQQKTDVSGNTVHTDDLHIFYMRLTGEGLTENTDWKVAVEDTSGPTEHDGTMTSRVALTWTPATASHDWLILGNASIRVDSSLDKYEFEIFDSTGSAVLATHKREGEDVDEEQQQTLVAVLANLPASEQVVQFRTRDTADVATQNFYKESELFCLDLDLFEVHAVQSLGTLAQADNNPIEANNLEPTPLTAGDWFIVAGVRALYNASGINTRHRIQIDGVTDPVGFFDDPRYTQSLDATGEQYTTVAAMPNFAASAQNIDIDVEYFDGTSQSWNDRVAVAFSMELAVAGLSALLFATADGASVDVVNELDQGSPLFSSIDDNPSSPDDTDWINNA